MFPAHNIHITTIYTLNYKNIEKTVHDTNREGITVELLNGPGSIILLETEILKTKAIYIVNQI
jgi:hypothetical protein